MDVCCVCICVCLHKHGFICIPEKTTCIIIYSNLTARLHNLHTSIIWESYGQEVVFFAGTNQLNFLYQWSWFPLSRPPHSYDMWTQDPAHCVTVHIIFTHLKLIDIVGEQRSQHSIKHAIIILSLYPLFH